MNVIFTAILVLGVISAISASVLYWLSRAFRVDEDDRVSRILEILPQANCGGCGYPGCKGFADACVSSKSLELLYCPVGGTLVMSKVAAILGKDCGEVQERVAVLRCAGSCDKRSLQNRYEGAGSCALESALFSGETGCSYGCLGNGDCVQGCTFDAIRIDPVSKLPVIDERKCTACGVCVGRCPRQLIELRPKGIKSKRIYVACANKDKGAVARKNCTAACIGCSKCVKVCAFDAITVENNLAYIHPDLCRLCRKCVSECPTQSITEVNFTSKLQADNTPSV